ncbi:MarR family winged helix-turn-helix transcriptional regulator [Streptomyces sp. NPDC048527]|uniref:MarR family winged helix-turn-helix transcriptional regulator n=1 Tax=Streptomyces sp. NPDC048527 TaxID=3365568 RepID=UPI0037144C5F
MSDRKVTPEEVGLRYLSLGHHLRKVVDNGMTTGGLSLARTKVLQVLERRGAIQQSRLAQELGQAPRSVTQSVEALEREGLVERAADPSDGRSKLVRLTEKGSKALAAGTAAGERVLREAFGAMGREQLRDLDRLLDALQAGLPGSDRDL